MNLSRQNVWQKVLAKDALYNNYRFTSNQYYNHNQLKNLYLKRRTQLSREYYQDLSAVNQDPQIRNNYYYIRKNLLAKKYGPIYSNQSELGSSSNRSRNSRASSLLSLNRQMDLDLSDGVLQITGNRFNASTNSVGKYGEVVPTDQATVSRSLAGNETLAEGYAFAGIKHIFDHCSDKVTRIRFAHNDPSRLAVASDDGTISVCRTLPPLQESVICVMRDSESPSGITDLAWSSSNDFILTGNRESYVHLWNIESYKLARRYDLTNGLKREILTVEFQPINNNLFVSGTSDGWIFVTNLSTGKPVNNAKDKLGGRITCLAFEQASGCCLWVGNSNGVIQSYIFEPGSGKIVRARRMNSSAKISSLQVRSWVSREARDPILIATLADNTLLCFRITTVQGQLILRSRYPIVHRKSSLNSSSVRACFCPLISFRQGACVFVGGEDGNVLVYDIGTVNNSVFGSSTGISSISSSNGCLVTVLQGHRGVVTDVGISCDESVLASCDDSGCVILWKRVANQNDEQYDAEINSLNHTEDEDISLSSSAAITTND